MRELTKDFEEDLRELMDKVYDFAVREAQELKFYPIDLSAALTLLAAETAGHVMFADGYREGASETITKLFIARLDRVKKYHIEAKSTATH